MIRQQVKQDLRTIAEIGIVGVLGRVPRRMRRAAGRRIANEAWRKLQSLPTLDHSVTKSIVDWAAKEYGGYQLSQAGNSNSGGNPSNDGADTPPVADGRDSGENHEGQLDGGRAG